MDHVAASIDGVDPAHVEANEAQLRSILETIPVAMIVIDDAGMILSFSATAERIFGYAAHEIVGEDVSALMPSPDRERHGGYLRAYDATGIRRTIGAARVATARRRDGTVFPIEMHIGEAQVGAERVYTGFIRDLTERQRTAKQLHDLQHELAQVSRVTALGTLATTLAHELNQPLTAIANYVQAARDLLDQPNGETHDLLREALDDCATQSLRVGKIFGRLQDFIARGDSARRVEDLRRVVDESIALALIEVEIANVEVTVALDPGCCFVMIDRVQVHQVLVNLLHNALEAMQPVVGRRLHVTSSCHSAQCVQISVDDSGPGLPTEVAERLFEPFNSTKAHGLGLGLSICRSIVESHGGRIWTERSRLGGCAFHLTLLRANAAAA